MIIYTLRTENDLFPAVAILGEQEAFGKKFIEVLNQHQEKILINPDYIESFKEIDQILYNREHIKDLIKKAYELTK